MSCVAGAALALGGCGSSDDAASSAAPQRELIGCESRPPWHRTTGPTESRTLALLFADGPGAYHNDVLDILEQRHVRATFAVVGRRVEGNEFILRRMLTEGHVIANHTFTHADVSKGGGYREIRDTQAAIHTATGYTPCVFRPAYGEVNSKVVTQARSLGLNTIAVTIDPQDWAKPGSNEIYRRIVSRLHRGAIVLLHPGPQTVAALPEIIETIRARRYRLLTLPKLLGLPPLRSFSP
jgi:peptidoglycan/xylan/chitin deacetylase (PgdA/CDA1 family)